MGLSWCARNRHRYYDASPGRGGGNPDCRYQHSPKKAHLHMIPAGNRRKGDGTVECGTQHATRYFWNIDLCIGSDVRAWPTPIRVPGTRPQKDWREGFEKDDGNHTFCWSAKV